MNRQEVLIFGSVLGLIVLISVFAWSLPSTTVVIDDPPPVPVFVPDDPSLIARHNEAVGLMGQFDYDRACVIFEALVAEHPDWLDAQVNLAIATLNRQAEGDDQRALDILNGVLARNPENVRAHYGSGLLKQYLQSSEEAIEHFRIVTEAVPDDAYAAYRMGDCLSQQRDHEGAREWFEKAHEIDPFLRSAYYALAQAYQRTGMGEQAGELLKQFERLENNPMARLIEFKYTRMGPLGDVHAIGLANPVARPLPEGELFSAASALLDDGEGFTWNADARNRAASLTVADLNGDGHLDLFIADALRQGVDANNAVIMNNGDGTYRLDVDHVLATVSAVNAALWSDVDNDGLTDAYLCRRGTNQLWRQMAGGAWTLVADEAGAGGGSSDTVDGAVFDADHDGDVDFFCVNSDGPNELLNNNLDGTFRPIAADQGLAGAGAASRQVLVTDLDRDRDADIVVINDAPPHEVYINDRGWAYRTGEGFDSFIASDIRAAVAADTDANGLVELYTLDSVGTVTRWSGDVHQAWNASVIHNGDAAEAPRRHQLAVCDANGDGRLDVVVSSGSTWQVVDIAMASNAAAYAPAEKDLPLDGWALANLACGEGSSLVGLPVGGPPLVWSPGPGRHGFVSLGLSGLHDDAETSVRSNSSGVGVQVHARMDSIWTARDTYPGSSGPGQSLQPLALGTAGHGQIDFVELTWSDGLLQTEIHGYNYKNKDQAQQTRDFTPGSCEVVQEIQRLKSSCPVLFVWNGERYEFVSDFLGVGGLGYMVAPGEYAPPRPWENLMLPDGLLKPKDGRFELKVGEPMQEACYLDAVRLVHYDLPPGWSMTLDERMSILGPEPTGEPRFYRESVPVSAALNDRGDDVTSSLLAADRTAAPLGEIDRRFIGRLVDDHILTLGFDEPIDDHAGVPMLIADGWIEYPYSQTMFAAWQAGADYRAPSIEARGADGQWVTVLEQFGYPAGMPRQMSVPLENLPAGTRELRITSNLELYWDRLFIAWAEDCPEATRIELPLLDSTLRQTGFALHTTSGQAVPDYDYDQRSPFWDTRSQRGAYTAFGPVDELVSRSDDALAIIGPGEEVHFEFGLPVVLAEGWSRVLVLESAGWCKDMDLYTKDGMTVGPLPSSGRDTSARDDLHSRYNTRLSAGN